MKNFGYDKDYIKKCLINKEFNYATASQDLPKYHYNENLSLHPISFALLHILTT